MSREYSCTCTLSTLRIWNKSEVNLATFQCQGLHHRALGTKGSSFKRIHWNVTQLFTWCRTLMSELCSPWVGIRKSQASFFLQNNSRTLLAIQWRGLRQRALSTEGSPNDHHPMKCYRVNCKYVGVSSMKEAYLNLQLLTVLCLIQFLVTRLRH